MLVKFLGIAAIGVAVVSASPVPQTSSCDQSCLSIANVATSCGTSVTTETAQCYCTTGGFVSAAQACVDCGGGTYFSGSNLDLLRQAIQACATLQGSGASSLVTGASSLATSVATASSAVASSAASGSAVAYTGTDPVTIEAWAPSGYSPTLTYYVTATGGENTTIQAVETVTVTNSASEVLTATVTVGFILDEDEIIQYQAVGGYTDVTACELEDSEGNTRNGTVAECAELLYSGTVAYSTSLFTLTGATSDWVAYPTPTSGLSVSSAITTSGGSLVPTATSASSSAAGGVGVPSLGGIPLGTVGGAAPSSSASSG